MRGDTNAALGALAGLAVGLVVLAASQRFFRLGALLGVLLGALAVGVVGAGVTSWLDGRED